MRKLLALAIPAICLLIGYNTAPRNSQASITLSSPYAVGGGGVVSESDASSALMGMSVDSVSNTLTAIYRYGTATTSGGKTTALAPGAQAPTVTVFFNANQGTWTASSGQSGTLTGGELTAVQSIIAGALTASRDPGETFAINHNLFGSGGVSVPW